MTTFLLIAACMAALAAAAVALPLIRGRQALLGAAAAVLMVGAAAALYPLWSNWDWNAPDSAQADATGPDVAAMVKKLEQHLQAEPADLKGWVMLGRSYVALQRADDAVDAYEHAHRLDAANVDAMMGLGEAMSLRARGEIPPEAAQLFEQAVAAAPDNPKALLYGGFAAALRGDRAAARARWEALKAMNPPPQITELLDARLAELGPTQAPNGIAMPGASAPGTSPSPGGTGTSPGASASAEATVNISITPALKARLKAGAPLFVFAREPGGHGPPLAAKRLTSASIGTQVHLSAADSMLPGRVLTVGQRVSITARVAFSGQPLPAAGDLYGEVSYDVGRDGARDLVIDRIAE
jgi:cytochrome c-type biogenesis protein CcmH